LIGKKTVLPIESKARRRFSDPSGLLVCGIVIVNVTRHTELRKRRRVAWLESQTVRGRR